MNKLPVETGDVIKHASEIIKTARSLVFSIVLTCSYLFVTVLSTKDFDFVTGESNLNLPIIGTPVSIYAFYLFAPIVLLIQQVYFYSYTQKLWILVAATPADLDINGTGGRSPWKSLIDLEHVLHPWLAMDFARQNAHHLDSNANNLSKSYSKVVFFLLWLLVPATILIAAIETIALRHFAYTLAQIALLSISCMIAFVFFFQVKWALKGKELEDIRDIDQTAIGAHRLVWQYLTRSESNLFSIRKCAIFLIPFLALFSTYYFLVWALPPDWNHIRLDLARSELSELPDDWPDPINAISFRDNNEGAQDNRGEQVKLLPQVTFKDFSNQTMWHADLTFAIATASNFTGADLSHAALDRAQFQNARFGGGTLSDASVELSDFSGASFLAADLKNAKFRGSSLIDAQFNQADLKGAEFVGGLLDGANFAGANLRDATFTVPRSLEETVYGSPTLDLRQVTFGWGNFLTREGELVRLPTIVAGAKLQNATFNPGQGAGMCKDDDTELPANIEVETCPPWILELDFSSLSLHETERQRRRNFGAEAGRRVWLVFLCLTGRRSCAGAP